ncbi:X2-like carbohydrate binding domain-containing protein [Cohnella lupini]|uniref:Putative sugar-binding protein n=1 Tax=Cohnella lupini TaxID=1294267 RepID=A0A3D9I4Z8_9BACL|nr:X2-like carbohydrate binding domain-containing protein [Cohnella lupini]RED56256.1 putative sugar-binding protein [Cohnella lupini]
MRKRALIWIMTFVMVFTMLPFSGAVIAAESTPGATIYVATTGNDNTGDGTQLNPYQTIAKAKAVVRTLPKTGGDIVVQIADGYYPLDETLVFDKDDSGSASSTIRYEAAPGAKPVISAGTMLEKGIWTEAVGLTQTGGLTAYKTTLNRSDKLRAIYVNDKRANMTLSSQIASANRTVTGTPTVSFTATDNPWAWRDGSNIRAAIVFDASVGLTTATKNPQNIEAESMGGSTARWARPFVTFASIEQAPVASNKPGGVMLRFQMPYAAISQSLSNNTQYNPGNNQVIRNAFEFFNKRGDFYFDQAESTLYYIPLEGEDVNTADVIIPRLETVLDIRGIPVGDRLNPVAGSDDGRVKNITFNGLTFAHTDYKLTEVTGTYTFSDGSGPVTTSSRGFASVQGAIVNKAYFPSSINWHETFYRSYDIPPAAVMINAARNIKVLNGEIGLAGFIGIHVENDAKNIEITGNYIVDTLASGIVIGHPQHIYENDVPITHESSVSVSGTPIRNWAGVDKEKYTAGTEAVPENIYITNNFLYRNCYGFPGANSLTSFYTTNMQVLHNYIYDSTYGAMSIGWGWDEYDGFGFTAQGTNKTGGPYHGTHETSLGRSPAISTTSRNNKINSNRVEEICTVVNDSGAIYSLGRQGDPGNLPDGGTWDTINTVYPLTNDPVSNKNSNWNSDNWTNFTEMNYNFLDPNPTNKPTTSNNWTNGFHPDEGSTFIKMIGNVVQSKLSHSPGKSRLIEFNNWKRKSDMIMVQGYVDGDNDQNGAPRTTFDNFKSTSRIWPLKGNEIVLNSGLTNEYAHMIPRSLIADTEFELASNVIMGRGETLNRRGLLQAQDTVWLAPADATVFTEGSKMTKAAGDAKSIKAPSAAGEYKLFIDYADARETATSKFTVYVDQNASAINVEDGESYEVSAVRPLELTLSGDYTYTLNSNPVVSGHQIATEGNWTLVVSTPTDPNAMIINFTTTISVANKLLPADVTVAPGGRVNFAHDLDDATKKIWISSSSGGHFDGGDDESMAPGDRVGMTAPMVPGPYIIYVLAQEGDVLSQSHARIVVRDMTPADIPRNGLDLWLKADEGVEKDGSGNVTGWTNMGSVPAKLVPANVPGSGGDGLGTPTGNPMLKNNVYDYVDFAAMSRPLKAAGFKNYNGSTQMTIYTLVSPTATANNSSDQNGLVYFGLNEAYQTWTANSGWSGINLGVGTDRINIRFGNTDSGVSGGGQQIATTATNGLVSVRAQLNGTNRSVFVNNNVIGTPGTNAKALLGNSSDLGVGYTMAAATPYRFLGKVLQVLIYDRVLTADEITKVETYFNEVKAGRGGPANTIVPVVDKTLLTGLIGTVNSLNETEYTIDSWNAFASALSEAQTAAANDGIGQEATDNSYYALRNAFKALVMSGTIEPTTASFDKNVANQADVTTVLTLNGNSLSSIANGDTTLQLGIDYVVSGNTVTINKSYLSTLAVGNVTLQFTFSSGATNELVITISDTTVIVPTTPKAVLTGPSSVVVNHSFEAKVALEGVQENYNAASLVVHYDPAKLEIATVLDSDNQLILDEGVAESLAPGVSIIGTGVIPEQGLILIMLTSTSGHVPLGTADLLKLNAKASASLGSTTVTLSEFVIANADSSTDVDVSDATLAIQVNLADPTALLAAIQSAQSLHDSAVEGEIQGQYPAGSKAVLNTAINAARAIANEEASTQTDVDTALAGLNAAVQTFIQSVIGINKMALNTAITNAEQLYGGASIGTSPGQYPSDAASAFNSAIEAAIEVRNSTSVTQNQINAAVTALNMAVSTFQSSVITQTPSVNKSALNEAITAAESKLSHAVEGQKIGQYPGSAISAFNAAVQTAKTVFGQTVATQSEVDAAVTALAIAQTTFAGQVVTLVSGQSAVSIRDLSIIAKYFNIDQSDPNWSKVEKADLFNNGKITIVELAAVARMIVGNWLEEHH